MDEGGVQGGGGDKGHRRQSYHIKDCILLPFKAKHRDLDIVLNRTGSHILF